MSSSKEKTIIFDFDGTLADTVDLVVGIYNAHAQDFGAEQVSPDEFSGLRKMGYKKAMKAKKLKWHAVPRLIVLIRREMKRQIHQVQPYEGIQNMLRELKKAGFSIGILTSNDGALVQEYLQTHDFPPFDFVVSEKTIFGKDKALKRIMQRHKLEKHDVVYVGDEPRDVAASKKAGVKVIGVTWGFGGPESMESSQPDITVTTIPELKKALVDA